MLDFEKLVYICMFLTYYRYYMIGHNTSRNDLQKTICTQYCMYIQYYIHKYIQFSLRVNMLILLTYNNYILRQYFDAVTSS